MAEFSQFDLLKTRRFLPFFITQALGAFNDNLYKNALLILISFTAASAMPFDTDIAVNLAAGFFMLPFFLFSATAGEIADKYDKASIMRKVKLAEIVIMAIAAVGLLFENYLLLFVVLFFMGAQSAFFGPVKYAVIPQVLKTHEVVAANALVEMGTFVAILVGTLAGGILAGLDQAHELVALGVFITAVIGYLSSRKIPAVPASNPGLKLDWNPIRQTWRTLRISHGHHSVFIGIMSISWFWFMGASYLTQFPNYTKEVLQGNEQVVTLLLALFSIGIGIGSMLTDRLSGHKLELGLVPLGAIGVSLFGVDMSLVVPVVQDEPLGFWAFLQQFDNLRILADLLMLGISGGLFIVPLYALVQLRSDAETRSQAIAALNIYNAIFMVFSAIAAALLLGYFNLSIPTYFTLLSVLNILVLVGMMITLPEFYTRFKGLLRKSSAE